MHQGLTPVWCLLFFLCTQLVSAAPPPSPSPPPQEEAPAEIPRVLQEDQIESTSTLDPGTVKLSGDSERLRPKRAREFQIGTTKVTVTGAVLFDGKYKENFNLLKRRNRDEVQLRPRMALDIIANFPNGASLFTERASGIKPP